MPESVVVYGGVLLFSDIDGSLSVWIDNHGAPEGPLIS
jgi:hypothetical protein